MMTTLECFDDMGRVVLELGSGTYGLFKVKSAADKPRVSFFRL